MTDCYRASAECSHMWIQQGHRCDSLTYRISLLCCAACCFLFGASGETKGSLQRSLTSMLLRATGQWHKHGPHYYREEMQSGWVHNLYDTHCCVWSVGFYSYTRSFRHLMADTWLCRGAPKIHVKYAVAIADMRVNGVLARPAFQAFKLARAHMRTPIPVSESRTPAARGPLMPNTSPEMTIIIP